MSRFVPFLALASIVLLWLLADNTIGRTEADEKLAASPAGLSDPALDSVWYCPIGGRAEGGFASQQIKIANVGANAGLARVAVIRGDGLGGSREIELPAGQTQTIEASAIDPLTAGSSADPLAAVKVEVVGALGAVTHKVQTPGGVAEGICATQPSDTWYFASGRSRESSKDYLAILNPFPEDISVDVTLQEIGRSRPTTIEALQGFTLFANSVRLVPVHEVTTGKENVAAIVKSRTGRVVVERLQIIDEAIFAADQKASDTAAAIDAGDGDETPDADTDVDSTKASGASLQLGVSDPQTNWYLVSGRVNGDTSHFVTVYNPAEKTLENRDRDTAEVELAIWPDDDTEKDALVQFPVQREVAPGSIEVVDMVSEAKRLGFRLPADFSVQVVSTNGKPVVAERWQYGREVQDNFQLSVDFEEQELPVGDAFDPGTPANEDPANPNSQTASVMTSAGIGYEAVTQYIIPPVTVSGASTWVTVYALESGTDVTVTLGGETQSLSLTGTQRRGFVRLSGNGQAFALVEATKPVYVETQIISPQQSDVVPAVPLAVNR